MHAGKNRWCILALEDGTFLRGEGFGSRGTQTGEVVFHTSITGYQEILTDPSYCGQIVTMTCPQIGNYGVNDEDVESSRIHSSGFVVREMARRPSNHRATQSLEDYLNAQGVIGLQGVDTRALTRKLRVKGAMRGVITTEIEDPAECVRLARAAPAMTGRDLVQRVAPREAADIDNETFGRAVSPRSKPPRACRVAAIDCGMKRRILFHLAEVGCLVRIFPPTVSASELFDYAPEGVLVSNGPGDPQAVTYVVDLLRAVMGRTAIFGICLGHQLLGLALGAKSFKLPFGHHGANQPVRNTTTGCVEITSQNHGFAIETDSLERAGGIVTHTNLNDHTLEGFVHKEMPLLAVQYHPEAGPGPHDATYLFDCFRTMMVNSKALTAVEMAAAQRDRRLPQTSPPVQPAIT